jgi:PAS domain S-box-containing protein
MSEPVAVAPTFFNPRTRPAAQRWVASAIAWALAAALTVSAAHATSGAKFVFFWFAVLFAAWVSGIGAAALSAVSAAILVGVLRHQAGMSPTDEVSTIVLWLVPVAFGSVLASTLASQSSALARYAVELRRAIDSARAAGVELEAQRAALERSNELLQEQAAELEMQAEELQATTATLEERTEESEATARRALFAADVGTTLVSGGSLDAMMQRCCEAAVAHLGAAFARVWVLEEQEPTLRLIASAGCYTHLDGPHSRVPVGQFKIGLIAAERRPHMTNQVVGDARVHDQAWAAREGMVAFAGFPLIVGDRLVGVIALFARRELAGADFDALGTAASAISVAISSARHLEAEARARAQLAANEARYRTLAEVVPVQVWTAKPDGGLNFVSEHTAAYFGVPAWTLLGDGWARLVHPDDLPAALAQWTESLATGRRYQAEFRLRAPDGSYRWHLTRAVAERDASGAIVGWVGSNTDMQDERAARAEAETANQAKADFLTMMSHELRTPLNAIGGYAELIEMGVHGPVSDEQRVALERIQRSQRHLLGLINGVLNFAKVDAGAVLYDFEPVPLHEVLATCEALTAPQVRAKQIRFHHEAGDPGLRAHADREKVQQIILNLLSNAVKFTESGGSITLECLRGDAYHLLVRVTDTGRGIADDQLERVFQPFVQVDAALTRTTSGTGLGLSISRDLARGMGGDLTVTSAPGVGSTFTLTLMSE